MMLKIIAKIIMTDFFCVAVTFLELIYQVLVHGIACMLQFTMEQLAGASGEQFILLGDHHHSIFQHHV